MSVEENNKALVRRFFDEVYNRGNLDKADELLSFDYVDHTVPPGRNAGREGLKRSVAKQRSSSSDLHISIEEQIAEGDKVVTWVVGSGTHDRERFMGLAPTGERMTVKHIIISRVVEGRIVEEWRVSDVSDMWQRRLQRERIERERVEQELRVARTIQRASLPEEVPELEGWQIAPYYQPAREVGGDFYDFLELKDGRLGIVIGDATGKGVPAALVMASARSMLRAVAQASDYSPGDVLSRVNDSLVSDIPPNMFVTCFYAVLGPESGHLRYANAGHDMPYLHRSGTLEELRARGMPLGLMPGMSYEEKETSVHGDEAALFYSDGLVEAHSPEGEMFGFPKLQALIAEHGEERSLGEFVLDADLRAGPRSYACPMDGSPYSQPVCSCHRPRLLRPGR
ncbi:MAG: SpoIIE family protein phosphatase [Actinomycetota bacterium]|nr:SpoIIE family protein phosphatase [Actinomycetota bacterium]